MYFLLLVWVVFLKELIDFIMEIDEKKCKKGEVGVLIGVKLIGLFDGRREGILY